MIVAALAPTAAARQSESVHPEPSWIDGKWLLTVHPKSGDMPPVILDVTEADNRFGGTATFLIDKNEDIKKTVSGEINEGHLTFRFQDVTGDFTGTFSSHDSLSGTWDARENKLVPFDRADWTATRVKR